MNRKENQSMHMPKFGLGTWRLTGKTCQEAVESALEIGYKMIDTALLYENHQEIGRALECIPRSRIFLSSKFAIFQLENLSVEKSCNKAMLELGTDYLDLFSLHYPDRKAPMEKIMRELASLQEKEKIRHFGVCNCTVRHLKDMLLWGLKPFANQVEFHPYLYQRELLDFCQSNGIQLVAYRSLGKGELLQDPLICDIAEKYEKTAAQLLLRWCLDKGVAVIPKASTREHLEENLQLYDFVLSSRDQQKLDTISTQKRFCVADWSDFDYV